MKYGVKRKYFKADTRVCPYGSEFYVEYDNMGVFESEQLAFNEITKDIQKGTSEIFDYINDVPAQEDLDVFFDDLYVFNFGKINCKKENNSKIVEYISIEDELEGNSYYLIKQLEDSEVDSFKEFYEF
jgi:hypothetical protein